MTLHGGSRPNSGPTELARAISGTLSTVCAIEGPPTTGGNYWVCVVVLSSSSSFWVVCIPLRPEGRSASIFLGSSWCVFDQVVDRWPQNHSHSLQAWPMRQTSAHAFSPQWKARKEKTSFD